MASMQNEPGRLQCIIGLYFHALELTIHCENDWQLDKTKKKPLGFLLSLIGGHEGELGVLNIHRLGNFYLHPEWVQSIRKIYLQNRDGSHWELKQASMEKLPTFCGGQGTDGSITKETRVKSIEYKLEPKFFPWKEILRAMCEEVASRKKDFDLAGVRWRGKYVDEEGKEWTGLPLFEDCRDHEDLARRGCGKSTLNHLNKKKAEYMKDLRLLPKKLAQKHQQIKVEQEAQKRKEKEIEKKRQQIIWEERERAKARREIELEEQNATPTDIDGSGAATAPPDAGQSEQKETEAVRSEKSLRKVNLNRFAIVLKYPVQEVPTAGLHQSIGSGKLLRLGTIVTQKKHTLFNFLAEAANQGDFAFITENKSAVSRLRKAIRQTAEQNGIEILGDPLPWDGPNRYRSAIPVRIAPDNYKSEGHLPYQDDPWYDRVKNSCEH